VTLIRTPLQIKCGQQKYDWTATIEAVDGGVVASTDEFMYRAPESGYEPKLTVAVSAQDPKWSAEGKVAFYLKSHGKYGRVTAEFTTDYDRPKTGFRIDAYFNPTGSRNLEYDPMQDVAPLPNTPSGSHDRAERTASRNSETRGRDLYPGVWSAGDVWRARGGRDWECVRDERRGWNCVGALDREIRSVAGRDFLRDLRCWTLRARFG